MGRIRLERAWKWMLVPILFVDTVALYLIYTATWPLIEAAITAQPSPNPNWGWPAALLSAAVLVGIPAYFTWRNLSDLLITFTEEGVRKPRLFGGTFIRWSEVRRVEGIRWLGLDRDNLETTHVVLKLVGQQGQTIETHRYSYRRATELIRLILSRVPESAIPTSAIPTAGRIRLDRRWGNMVFGILFVDIVLLYAAYTVTWPVLEAAITAQPSPDPNWGWPATLVSDTVLVGIAAYVTWWLLSDLLITFTEEGVRKPRLFGGTFIRWSEVRRVEGIRWLDLGRDNLELETTRGLLKLVGQQGQMIETRLNSYRHVAELMQFVVRQVPESAIPRS
jgi:membrane protein implicated in regulation of membrane protease activity